MFPLIPPFLEFVSIKSTISRGCSIALIQTTGGCQIGCSLPWWQVTSAPFTSVHPTWHSWQSDSCKATPCESTAGLPRVLGSVWKFGTMWDEKVGRLGKWWFNQQKWGFHGIYSWIILIMIVQLAHLSWSCFGLRAIPPTLMKLFQRGLPSKIFFQNNFKNLTCWMYRFIDSNHHQNITKIWTPPNPPWQKHAKTNQWQVTHRGRNLTCIW